MTFANLNEYKAKKGISSREIARQLKISESYLSEILSKQRTPSKQLAVKISKITGIPILNLLFPHQEKS